MEVALVAGAVVFLGLLGTIVIAILALVKANQTQGECVKALERLGKAAMDRILILKDYQAYTLLNKDKPASKLRRTETRKI